MTKESADSFREAIAALTEEADSLERQALAVRGRRDVLVRRRSFETWGVRPGVKVKTRQGRHYVVTLVCIDMENEKPWLRGRLIKKDGTASDIERLIMDCDWELVK